MTFVAPRIVNDVSYVTRIKHASHFVYLVTLTCHFSWQAQYLVKAQVSLFMAVAVFGEAQVSLSGQAQ